MYCCWNKVIKKLHASVNAEAREVPLFKKKLFSFATLEFSQDTGLDIIPPKLTDASLFRYRCI
jgi:hypothetical protein